MPSHSHVLWFYFSSGIGPRDLLLLNKHPRTKKNTFITCALSFLGNYLPLLPVKQSDSYTIYVGNGSLRNKNYLTNLGNRREHEWFNHTSESQTSRIKLLQVKTPAPHCLYRDRNNGCVAAISSAHLQAVISIKTKMSTKNKRKYLGLQNCIMKSLNISELTIIVVFQGYSFYRLKMWIH